MSTLWFSHPLSQETHINSYTLVHIWKWKSIWVEIPSNILSTTTQEKNSVVFKKILIMPFEMDFKNLEPDYHLGPQIPRLSNSGISLALTWLVLLHNRPVFCRKASWVGWCSKNRNVTNQSESLINRGHYKEPSQLTNEDVVNWGDNRISFTDIFTVLPTPYWMI